MTLGKEKPYYRAVKEFKHQLGFWFQDMGKYCQDRWSADFDISSYNDSESEDKLIKTKLAVTYIY
jgi:hypothetical protein